MKVFIENIKFFTKLVAKNSNTLTYSIDEKYIMGLIKSLKGISLIGIGDITANGISAIFWFYLATLILPSEYGQIHYFISIAAIASTFSLI